MSLVGSNSAFGQNKKLFSSMKWRRKCVLVWRMSAAWSVSEKKRSRCVNFSPAKWLRSNNVKPKKRHSMTSKQ